MKHYITDEDINRVSIKNLPYHDENTCKILEVYSKQLLQVARDKNDSNECGILLDSFDLTRSQWFKGIENKVQLTVNLDDYVKYSKDLHMHRYLFLHNHPSCSSFSKTDLVSFADNDGIYFVMALQNNGIANILIKTSELPELTKVIKDLDFKESINLLKAYGVIYLRRYSNV